MVAGWRGRCVSPLTASHLHCTAGFLRSCIAIRKDAGLYCGSRLRSGELFDYLGLPHNLKDLKDIAPWRVTVVLDSFPISDVLDEDNYQPLPPVSHPDLKTLNPNAKILGLPPSTPNPKPYTLDPKPEIRNPKSETRNPRPETQNPKPETQNPKPRTPKL